MTKSDKKSIKYSLIYSKFPAKSLRPRILQTMWGCILTIWVFTSLAQGSTQPSMFQSTDSSGDSVLPEETLSGNQNNRNPVYVNVVDGTVSVKIEEMPLGEVLVLLANQSNIKVKISGDEGSRKISGRFSSLPMEKALHRLLRETNYALVYSSNKNNDGNNNTVTGIVIMNPGQEAPPEIKNASPQIKKPDTHALIESLDPDTLPIGVKQSLIDAIRKKNPEFKQAIKAQKTEAFAKLLEQLEILGATETETIKQLRKTIDQLKIQKKIKE